MATLHDNVWILDKSSNGDNKFPDLVDIAKIGRDVSPSVDRD